MVVHRSEPRQIERFLRELPPEPPAEDDVGVETAQERRHVLLVRAKSRLTPSGAVRSAMSPQDGTGRSFARAGAA